MSWLLEHHAEIYFWIYAGTLALIAVAESYFPKRTLHPGMGRRWFNNLLVHLADIGAVRLVYPVLGVSVVLWAAEQGWGLLPLLDVPNALAWLLTFLLIDLAYYLQHRLLHRVPILWRLHRTHHTDRDYDFTTGLRFHPLEALFTTGYDLLILLLLGPPPEAAILYIFLHLVWSILVHANIAFPYAVDRVVRIALVTPDLHRTHHSAEPGESLTNFAAVSPAWDRLFGTYRDQPQRGHSAMVIGLPGYQDAKHQGLADMLLQPFVPAIETEDRAVESAVETDR